MVTVSCTLFIFARAVASTIRCMATSRKLCSMLDSQLSGIICRSGISTSCLPSLALHRVAPTYGFNASPAQFHYTKGCSNVARISSSINCSSAACLEHLSIVHFRSIVRACCCGAFGLIMTPLSLNRDFASEQFRADSRSMTKFLNSPWIAI